MALYHTLVARNVELRVILIWAMAFLHGRFGLLFFAVRSNIVTMFMTLVAAREENKIDPNIATYRLFYSAGLTLRFYIESAARITTIKNSRNRIRVMKPLRITP